MKSQHTALYVLVAAAFVLCVATCPASAATWTTFDPPDSYATLGVYAINSSGQMAGTYVDATNQIFHGFFYDGATFHTIDAAGAVETYATGIHDSGEIVGYYYDGSHSHGYTLVGSTLTTFDYPGATDTYTGHINNSGQLVGFYRDSGGHNHGFELSGGVFTTIDVPGSTATLAYGINNLGDIVGEVIAPGTFGKGFLLLAGHYNIISFPGAVVTSPQAINDARVIVGTILSNAGDTRNFVFHQGQFSNIIKFPGAGSYSAFLGIDNAGNMVGGYSDSLGSNHGFIRIR